MDNIIICTRCHTKKEDAVGMKNGYCYRCILQLNNMNYFMNRDFVFTGQGIIETYRFFHRNGGYITRFSAFTCKRCNSPIVFDDMSRCCGNIYYCNIKCQTKDLHSHKNECYRMYDPNPSQNSFY